MFLQLNGPTAIVLMILFTIVAVGLLILLYKSVRKENSRYKEEKSITIEGLVSKSAITSQISYYLRRISTDSTFSLLLLEIQDYQNIIDAFGRDEAERTIEKAIYRVIQMLPKRVQIASFGGTRFLIFLKTEYDRFFAIDLAKKIITLMSRPIKIFRETNINLVSNIGVVFYPQHGTKFKQLVNSLNIALHNAIKAGDDRYIVYSQKMNPELGDNVEYHFEIKEAIEKKEFAMEFQPIVDIDKNDLYGFEVFVRWNHPKHGVLAPVQFLNIMEQSGDISWIATWGMEFIIQKSFELTREFPDLKLNYTINISPRQLTDDKIIDEFGRLVRRYKMDTTRVSLEIAEYSTYIKNSAIKANLERLIKLGFNIVINGFGLDYTTLTELESMEIDAIRLDKYFFDKETESYLKNRLANIIIDYAKDNDIIVIAESIETHAMHSMVKELGIKYIQGYIYSKPFPESKILEYIRGREWMSALSRTQEEIDEAVSKEYTRNILEEKDDQEEKEYIPRSVVGEQRLAEERMLREAMRKQQAPKPAKAEVADKVVEKDSKQHKTEKEEIDLKKAQLEKEVLLPDEEVLIEVKEEVVEEPVLEALVEEKIDVAPEVKEDPILDEPDVVIEEKVEKVEEIKEEVVVEEKPIEVKEQVKEKPLTDLESLLEQEFAFSDEAKIEVKTIDDEPIYGRGVPKKQDAAVTPEDLEKKKREEELKSLLSDDLDFL